MKRLLPILVFFLLAALLPLGIRDPYYLSVLVFIGIYSIATMGLNLLMGYAGQISLGHAAFFAIGAYTSGILTAQYQVHFSLAALAALAVSAAVAYVIGLPCLRLKGHYLAMATLAFGEIVYIFLNAEVAFTGGPSGLSNIPQLQVGGFAIDSDLKYYYVVWGAFCLLFIVTQNIINSRIGRALRSLHGSELAAAAMGVNVAGLKVQVFVLSALYAAFAGVLYAHSITFISPQTGDLMFSIRLVTMVVVGGMGHMWGGLLGAAILTLLPEGLRVFEDYDMLIYGAILLVMVMFLPGGLVRGLELSYRKMFRSSEVQQHARQHP